MKSLLNKIDLIFEYPFLLLIVRAYKKKPSKPNTATSIEHHRHHLSLFAIHSVLLSVCIVDFHKPPANQRCLYNINPSRLLEKANGLLSFALFKKKRPDVNICCGYLKSFCDLRLGSFQSSSLGPHQCSISRVPRCVLVWPKFHKSL